VKPRARPSQLFSHHPCLPLYVSQSVPTNTEMSLRRSVSRSSKLERRVSWNTGGAAVSKEPENRRSWGLEVAITFEKLEGRRTAAGSKDKGKGSGGPNPEDLQTGPPNAPSDSVPHMVRNLKDLFLVDGLTLSLQMRHSRVRSRLNLPRPNRLSVGLKDPQKLTLRSDLSRKISASFWTIAGYDLPRAH